AQGAAAARGRDRGRARPRRPAARRHVRPHPSRGLHRRAGAGRRGIGADVRRGGRGGARHRGGARPLVTTISRREARRAAVFMLFQWDVTGRPLGSLYEGDVDEYTRQLAGAVTEHAEALDARITSASDDWTADRLGAVERNVLRVALEELDEGAVPVEVVLDEAITLAKRYASEDAGRLVNGILGKLVREGHAT